MPLGPGILPPALVLEASRQAGIAISHLFLDVPLDRQYLLDQLSLRWVNGLIAVSASTPVEAVLDVRVTASSKRRNQTHALSFAGSWFIDGCEVAQAAAEMRCVSPWAFRALRRTPARTTGRFDRPNGAVRRDGDSKVVVDWHPFDPMLFDHPVDHVPGMALIDAGLAAAGTAFESFGIEFLAFAELNTPLYLREEPADERLRTFVIDQGGCAIARVQITSQT